MYKRLTLSACLLVIFLGHFARSAWDIRQNLETKTPYWSQQDPSTYTSPPASCYPVHLNLVARHGTRQPTAKDVVALTDLQASIQANKDAITNPALQWIFSWKNPFEEQDAGYLVYRGEMEHYTLSKHFLSYFPKLLNATYEPSRYPFRSTQISRTGISANSFGYGFFEGRGKVGPAKYSPFFVTAANLTLDVELRFFSNCPKYESSVVNNETADIEKSLYSKMVVPTIAEQLTAKLGSNKWNLTTSDAKAFWKACVFQASVDDVMDQFCSLFDEEQVDHFNYIADLTSYYMKGYGYKIDYSIACPLLTNFMNAIDTVVAGPVDTHAERANLRFAHAETIMPFVALLGLYKDNQPLKHDDPADVIKNRQWRSSVIAPYASNVAFILYNCTEPSAASQSFRVKVMVNEKEMKLPGCDDQMYCPLDKVKQLYAEYIGCDFNTMCDIQTACTKPEDGDDDKWNINNPGGIIVVVTAAMSGLLVGMCLLALVLFALRHYAKEKENYEGYDMVEAGSAVHY